MSIFRFTPRPPEWRLDWDAIDREYEWVRAMADCPQSPEWHAEGNVHIHTRMVLESLVGMPAWRALPEGERAVVFVACLLHDVSKPEVTRVEPDGRISSRGHSRRGAIRAREILWRMEVPFRARELICGLILHHQVPFTLIDRPDAERTAITVSHETRCDLLALVTEADARGRICADKARLLDNIGLYCEAVKELGCFSAPFQFASAHARFLFFRDPNRSRHAPAHEDPRCEVTVMSGLPGAGKDRWIGGHVAGLPLVSLDGIREELDVDPADIQSRVIEEARERAREHLRSGCCFVWNATNLSSDLRSRIIELCAGYRARVRIVYVESPPGRLFQQNSGRCSWPVGMPQLRARGDPAVSPAKVEDVYPVFGGPFLNRTDRGRDQIFFPQLLQPRAQQGLLCRKENASRPLTLERLPLGASRKHRPGTRLRV